MRGACEGRDEWGKKLSDGALIRADVLPLWPGHNPMDRVPSSSGMHPSSDAQAVLAAQPSGGRAQEEKEKATVHPPMHRRQLEGLVRGTAAHGEGKKESGRTWW